MLPMLENLQLREVNHHMLGFALGAIAAGFILHLTLFSLRQRSTKPPSAPTLSGRVLLYGFIATVGLLVGLIGWSIYGSEKDDSDWIQTQGTITALDITDIDQNRGVSFSGDVTDPLYLVRLEFHYQVDSQEYVGNRRIANESLRDGQLELEPDELEAVQAKYAVGAAVDVFYDPADPEESALEKSDKRPYVALGLSSAVVGSLLAGFFAFPVFQYMWRRKDRPSVSGDED